jgi:hypothetical protein
MDRSPRGADPLDPVLKDAEAELSRRLREACEAEERGVSTDSTAEIRRLEDSLLAAAVAAQQTILLRRHIRERSETRTGDAADRQERRAAGAGERVVTEFDRPGPAGDLPEAEQDAADAEETVVREFTDETGRPWRAWPVTPRTRHARGTARPFLGEFQGGWICFEALDSPARRRLATHEPRWSELEENELRRLLEAASTAPARKQSANG